MFIQKLDPDKFGEAYNVKGQLVYPWEGVVTPPFGAGWGVIEPGGATKHHNHQEGETFFFIKGRGRMRIGDEVQEVGPGDVVYHPPFNGHILQNPSDTEELLFLSLWWEDRQLGEGRRESAVLADERPRRMVVAAALPESGPLRLDALAGPALAADVLVRYLKLRGVDARLAPLGGEVSGEAAETLRAAAIEAIEITEVVAGAVPETAARALLQRLQESSRLVEEGGGLSLPLRGLEKPLKDFYLKVGMGTHLRALLEQALAEGLAVPVIQPGGVLSPELIAAARAAERLREEETRVVECFGFDVALLHALHVPALLLAADPEALLPAAFVTHEALDPALAADSFLAGSDAGAARYHLAAHRPETEGTIGDRLELAELQSWQSWLAELGERLREERDGDIPWTGDWTEEHRRFYQRLEDLIRDAGEAYEARTFSTQRVVRVIAEVVRTARRFGKGEEHWRHVPSRSEERRTSLALELLAAKALVYLSAPLLPELAERLWHDLGYDTPLSAVRWEERPEWLPGGQKLRALGRGYIDSPLKSTEDRAA